MTARPIDPECRRRPVYAAVALVLVMAAVLLAAGCVLPGFNNQTPTLPKEKYVFLEHSINYNITKISGVCYEELAATLGPIYSFDESNGILTLANYYYQDYYQKEPVNDSMILFYGNRGSHGFVYSLPRQFYDNVTLDSIMGDGTVALRYNDKPIVLKPKEHWENNTYRIQTLDFPRGVECKEEIGTNDSFYNAGVFDKKDIVFQK